MSRKRKHTDEEWYNGVQRYGNSSAMKKENPSLYAYGRDHGLLKNIIWPNRKRKPRISHTRKEWDEAVRIYGDSSTMMKKANALYYYGYRHGWLKNTIWPNPKRHRPYTKKEWDEMVQLYGNPKTMSKHNPGLYTFGCRRGWNKTTVWPSRKSRVGVPEKQLKKEVFDASRKFHSRGEFCAKDHRNYHIAQIKNWLNEMYWLKPQENPYNNRINYIYLYLFEQQKTFYVGETYHGSCRDWEHKNRGPVFDFAKINNVEIPEPIILEDNLNRMNEVRKQEHYWKLYYISLGYKTLNKGKTGEFSGSLGGNRRIWTRKKCYDVALLCSHVNEMRKRFPGACNAAKKNGWMKDYTWFTVVSGKPKPVLQYTKDGQLVGQYDSILLAANFVNCTASAIGNCCRGKAKQSCGYVWRFANDTAVA